MKRLVMKLSGKRGTQYELELEKSEDSAGRTVLIQIMADGSRRYLAEGHAGWLEVK